MRVLVKMMQQAREMCWCVDLLPQATGTDVGRQTSSRFSLVCSELEAKRASEASGSSSSCGRDLLTTAGASLSAKKVCYKCYIAARSPSRGTLVYGLLGLLGFYSPEIARRRSSGPYTKVLTFFLTQLGHTIL